MLGIVADTALDERARAPTSRRPRRLRRRARSMHDERLLDWIRARPRDERRGRRRSAPARCCSAAAGLLDGLEATTHWASTASCSPAPAPSPTARRVVEQGKVITARRRVVGHRHGADARGARSPATTSRRPSSSASSTTRSRRSTPARSTRRRRRRSTSAGASRTLWTPASQCAASSPPRRGAGRSAPAGRRLRQVIGDCLVVAGSQPRREPAAVDLARRPPQRLRRRLAFAGAAGGVVAQVARPAAGQQPPAQHRAKRLALDVGAGVGGDVRGSGIGLLGGQPAELHREGDAVAGRPHALDAGDPAVRVDGHEPVGVGRDALGRAPAQARERENARRPPGAGRRGALQRARRPRVERRRTRRARRDAGSLELLADDLDGARAEDRQRRLLGRDDRDLGRHAHPARLSGDQQGELVGRQRPARAGRDDDRDAPAVPS